jgi:ferredoxin
MVMGKMAVRVDRELCTGCGTCIDACPFEAIKLVDEQAEIDGTICTECDACIGICPNEAIIKDLIPASAIAITPLPMSKRESTADQKSIIMPEMPTSASGIQPLAGAILAFLGNEVVPRLVDVLIKSIEHRYLQPNVTSIPPLNSSSSNYDLQNRGQRKHIRYRGGIKAHRKLKGRR